MIPRLILVNGVPASGKSTLGREWCSTHAEALPLCLDIDALRSMIGGWQSMPFEAGLAAREVAIAAVDAHLRSGRDVLVPQYLPRVEFIERLAVAAGDAGAVFIETALVIEASEASRRFRSRASFNQHADVWGGLSGDMHVITADFETLLNARPAVERIAAGPSVLRALEDAVRRNSPREPA